jgi:hypothetical protein
MGEAFVDIVGGDFQGHGGILPNGGEEVCTEIIRPFALSLSKGRCEAAATLTDTVET